MENSPTPSAAQPLRRGWTTGACATAAAAGAFEALLSGNFPESVTVSLPRGGEARFVLCQKQRDETQASCGVIKDAGDDPDVTHGALIMATVTRASTGAGAVFRAGEGVGTVTRPGLPLSIGEPAINPVPRAMMAEALGAVARRYKTTADVVVTLSIPGGEGLAEKTLNARLGIIGGLSILGTTGIVIPYSCSAWIAAIRQGIDVARACGHRHIAAATGRTSEESLRRLYSFENSALIDMGDFVGGLLKHLRDHPVERLTLGGGFGKMAKLAAGHMDLHSARSSPDMEFLARRLQGLGAGEGVVQQARACASAASVLALAQENRLPLGDDIARAAREVARKALNPDTGIEIVVFDRAGAPVGRAAF